jgi:hypothetical protein
MQLEHIFSEIDTKSMNLHDNLLLPVWPAIGRLRRGAVHPIKWKAKFGGLDVSDAKRLRSLEDENAKLKRLLAETMLDNAMLKDIATKKGDARRQARGRRSPSSRV